MRAMILAAGFGTRLWPLTIDRTKPAIPVLGTPLIGHVAQYLSHHGVQDVIINLHHEPDSVRDALGDGSAFGVKLHYVEEPEILGTSGALDNAKEFFGNESFVVINGKLITDIDLSEALAVHKSTNAIATLILKENPKREKFSEVLTRDGFVTRFGPMPSASFDSTEKVPLMFTGIQILDPRIFDYIPRNRFSHSTVDVYPQAIAAGERVVAHVGTGMWYELSTIPRYLDVSLELMRQRGEEFHLGKGCRVSGGAVVERSVLWDNVTVEDDAVISRSVIGDGVCIRRGERIENSAVVRACLVAGAEPPVKASRGSITGDNFVVSLSE
jgi:NDP-sugar pyrophosphorylase family protein